MSKKSLNCPNCGSAKVTEFKPGSFVCGTCESTFKQVDPSPKAVQDAGQAIHRSGADDCEICRQEGWFKKAVGRCVSCGILLCSNHALSSRGDDDDRFGIIEHLAEKALCKELHRAIGTEDREAICFRASRALVTRLYDVVHCSRCQSEAVKQVVDEVVPLCPLCRQRGFKLIPVEALNQDASASVILEPLIWFWDNDEPAAKQARESVLAAVRKRCRGVAGICKHCLDKVLSDALGEFAPKCTNCGEAVKYIGPSCQICGTMPICAGGECSLIMRRPDSSETGGILVCTKCFRAAKEVKKFLIFHYQPARWEIGGAVWEKFPPVDEDDYILEEETEGLVTEDEEA